MTLLTTLEGALRREAIRIYGGEAEVAKLLAFAIAPEPSKAIEGYEELLGSPLLPDEADADAATA